MEGVEPKVGNGRYRMEGMAQKGMEGWAHEISTTMYNKIG